MVKKGKGKSKKIEEEEEEDEEDEFTSESMSIFTDKEKNKYEDDLEKLGFDEKKQMEKEIKAALEGNTDLLDIEGLLEGSKADGISLNHFNSNESDMDLDEY